MGKFLQKIFKIISYFIFSKVYGKIEKSIKSNTDSRIKVEIVNIEKDLKYKIYKITDGRLYTDRIHDTAVILDNQIIEGPSFQLRYNKAWIFNSKIEENSVFNKGTPRVLKKLNGTTLSLLTGGAGNNNYHHWLYDVLPRLGLCSKAINLEKIDYFLFPDLIKKFQKETLDCLNIPNDKRLSSRKYRHIKNKELIVTDHPVVVTGDDTRDMQNMPNWIMLWLKNSFINNNILSNRKKKKKIYINRKDTKHSGERLISNESEIEKYLLEKNFISVSLGEIKFIDQVDLFYNAECIAGLQGAGFANIVFCEPGTKIIEFRSLDAGPLFENLAKLNNLNYHPVIRESKQILKSSTPNQQGSIHIPITILKKILENC